MKYTKCFKLINTDFNCLCDRLLKYRESALPLAITEMKKAAASYASFYADYKQYKPNPAYKQSALDYAGEIVKKFGYALLPSFKDDNGIYWMFDTTCKDMMKLFCDSMSDVFEQIDTIPTDAKFTGWEYDCIGSIAQKLEAKDLIQYIKPFEVRVTELALNLLLIAFEDEHNNENTADEFNTFLASPIGNNLLIEKKKHIAEIIKPELTEEDLLIEV